MHTLIMDRKEACPSSQERQWTCSYLLNLPCARDDTQQFEEMPVAHSIQLVSDIPEER